MEHACSYCLDEGPESGEHCQRCGAHRHCAVDERELIAIWLVVHYGHDVIHGADMIREGAHLKAKLLSRPWLQFELDRIRALAEDDSVKSTTYTHLQVVRYIEDAARFHRKRGDERVAGILNGLAALLPGKHVKRKK